MPGFSSQCKVRTCSQCQGDTDFFCCTCKHDLCLQCKERHNIYRGTMHHDIVIYRGKYEYIPQQKTCVRHPDIICKLYCLPCGFPVCFDCTEHRKHEMMIISTAYRNLQKHREFIHNVRSKCLSNSWFVLAGIKTDKKTCHKEIFNLQPEMSIKAHTLKNLINNVIYDLIIKYKRFMIKTLQKQKRNLQRQIATLENYENRYEQSAHKTIKFLVSLRERRFLKPINSSNRTQLFLLSVNEEINVEDVIKLLREIQIIETGKRQLRNDCLLKLMSTPVLTRTVTVKGVSCVHHICCVTADQICISDSENNLIFTNKLGDKLHHLMHTSSDVFSYGGHTLNDTCDLLYIARNETIRIKKLSIDNWEECTFIKFTEPWKPQCVYCSPSNGDLLVGMLRYDTGSAKVTRFNDTGQLTKTIQHNNTGQELYSDPNYITENRNGDVIVSDYNCGVVVTSRVGGFRFSYTGPPSGSRIWPRGICTDSLSHILVCDVRTDTVQMIDKDGHFLLMLLTQDQGIDRPQSLSYDEKTRHLLVGSYNNNKILVYRYIEMQVHLPGHFN